MSTSGFPKFLLLVSLVFLIMGSVSACQLFEGEENEKSLLSYLDLTPVPSTSLAPTASPATPNPLPKETQNALHQDEFLPGSEIFHHSQGSFEFPSPIGWELVRQEEGFVEFTSLDQTSALYVFTTNTGESLDEKAFRRLVGARETNTFSVYEGYREIDREYGLDGIPALVIKQLVFNGEQQTVVSLYDQAQECVLTADIWLNKGLSEALTSQLVSFFKEIRFFPEKVSKQPVYQWTYTFQYNNLFSIQVPIHWVAEESRTDTTQVSRFIAPNEEGFIQIIVYEDEEPLSGQEAGFITLELLRGAYGKGIQFTEDRILPGWSERLSWTSEDGSISGVTFRENADNKLIALTMTYPIEKEEIFLNLYHVLAESYRPQENGS